MQNQTLEVLTRTASTPMGDIPVTDINLVLRRILPKEEEEAALDVAAFNSSI